MTIPDTRKTELSTYQPACSQPAQMAATFQTAASEMNIMVSGIAPLARLIGFSKVIASAGCRFDGKQWVNDFNVGATHFFVEPGADCPAGSKKLGKITCYPSYPDLKTGCVAMLTMLRDKGRLMPILSEGDLTSATETLILQAYPPEDPFWPPSLRSEVWELTKEELDYAGQQAYFLITGDSSTKVWNDNGKTPGWYTEPKVDKTGGKDGDKTGGKDGDKTGGKDGDKTGGKDGDKDGESGEEGGSSSNALLIGGAVAALAAVLYFGTRKK